MQDTGERIIAEVRGSQMLRLFFVGFLALLLGVPILMISGLVEERQLRSGDAAREIESKWGAAQNVTGPALVLPYTHRWAEPLAAGGSVQRSETRHTVILPEVLSINGAINSETRSRGIFTTPVYTMNTTVSGEFLRPALDEIGIGASDVNWDKAYVVVGISDTRAIQRETSITWNGASSTFLPGTGALGPKLTGIQVPVALSATSERYTFSFPLSLNGSVNASFVPFGRNTTVELTSNYKHPSFQGNWLPAERTITPDGFSARWTVPYLGRGYPQSWDATTDMSNVISTSRFGVAMLNPVDRYLMAHRSVKYALLFVVLTFATVWLVEVLGGVRVHPIQYLMLGAAICIFYLLELSLSEHIGFGPAYGVASIAVVGMVGAFSRAALRGTGRAAGVASGVALLYTYLYLVLVNEDYALLAGSIGLFVALAAIMYATRKVDWFALVGKSGTLGGREREV